VSSNDDNDDNDDPQGIKNFFESISGQLDLVAIYNH
jgi:hypothetical protein